jgi:hypothetical protein
VGEATTHRQRFGHLAAQPDLLLPPPPVRNAWDGHDPLDLARSLMENARSLWQDPGEGWPMLGQPDSMSTREWRASLRGELWQPEELPDFLGFPYRGGEGKLLSKSARLELARVLLDLAGEEQGGLGWTYTSPGRGFRPVQTGLYEMMPPWLTEAIVYDGLTHDRRSRIKLISRDAAREFIAKHHRTHPRIRDNGWIYSIGLYNGRRLAAVATGHTVTGGWAAGKKKNRPPRQIPVYCDYDEVSADADVERVSLDPRNILELSRVASDGTVKGASSMLAARILKLAPATRRGDPDGPWLFVTYSLGSEEGSTYKALRELGLRPVHRRLPRRSKTGARVGGELLPHDYEPKIRWEAGPAAMPADPLLEAEFEKPRRRRRKKGRGRSASALSQIQRIADPERAALALSAHMRRLRRGRPRWRAGAQT